MAINQITLSGHIAAIEDTITKKGNSLTDIKLATPRWTGAGEVLEYHPVRLINISDAQRQLLQVGNEVLIEGQLTQNTWTDAESGQGRRQTTVLVKRFELLRVSQGNAPAVRLNDLASMLQRLGVTEEAADTMVLEIARMNQIDRDAALAKSR